MHRTARTRILALAVTAIAVAAPSAQAASTSDVSYQTGGLPAVQETALNFSSTALNFTKTGATSFSWGRG